MPLPSDKELVRKFITERREWFSSALGQGGDAISICSGHSDAMGNLIRLLFEGARVESGRVAVLALGGLARREMGPYCDIDLLFLHDGLTSETQKRLTDAILYPFWNNAVEAGGATRTITDAKEMIKKDVKTLTAMTEVRLISGDTGLFNELKGAIAAYFSNRRRLARYIGLKLKEQTERLKRFGDSVYLLEPNVKEAGLRDYHTVLWIARAIRPELPFEGLLDFAVENPSARAGLQGALGFLLKVRLILHIIEGRRQDRLSEALQPEVAKMLKFSPQEGMNASELLMSAYYRNSAIMRTGCERAIEFMSSAVISTSWTSRWFGKGPRTLKVRDESRLLNPISILEVFSEAKKRGLLLDASVKEKITYGIDAVDDSIRGDVRSKSLWMEIFSDLKNLGATLKELSECGLLLKWFPEMAPMMYLVKHDGFHFFTAGTHSIRAVGEIEVLAKTGSGSFGSYAKALGMVDRVHVLAAAVLFHDVGKGRGGGHAETGAILSKAIAERLGFSEVDAQDMVFLVRSHLLMSTLAFRRDIHDPELINRFAETMRTPELLAMLYLITFADLRSVAPGVLSNWKAGLLTELFERTLLGMVEDKRDLKKIRERRLKEVQSFLGKSLSESEVSGFLGFMPDRYLFSTDPPTVAAHMLLTRGLKEKAVTTAMKPIESKSCTEFSVVTRDAPGLFAKIAGVLSANGANIIDAQAYTNAKGLVIDVFLITDAVGRPIEDHEQARRIRDELSEVIAGSRQIEDVAGPRFKRRYLSLVAKAKAPQVIIDNDVSASETVIEIVADDRVGLLYRVAWALYELGLTIVRARITTLIDRVVDVFYVRSMDGAKVVSQGSLDRISETLKSVLRDC